MKAQSVKRKMQSNNLKCKTERIEHRGFDKSNSYSTDDTDNADKHG